ncbi:MAG: NUDIX domain-containing protein [Candidatus ainarchaeum sp.]|nr:NUDIX domain-containing protein [Candidatus ainarchaeum sp.]
MKKVPHDPNEIIALVDNNDNVISQITRKEAHEKSLLHREVYSFIINSKKEVLLQKRVDFGLWDSSPSGHFPKKQDYDDAIIREVKEELGLKLSKNDFQRIGKEYFKSRHNTRFATIYFIRKNFLLKDFVLDKEEVSEVKYFNKKEINKLLENKEEVLTKATKYFLKKFVLKEL